MVEYNPPQMDLVFRALADPTRRSILGHISRRPRTVTEIAESFDMSLNGVSKHLKVLEKSGLMVRHREGRQHFCRMDPRPLKKVDKFLHYHMKFWDRQLDALEKFLEETKDS